jgi:CRISPR-associated endonuclease/helicase Cas3
VVLVGDRIPDLVNSCDEVGGEAYKNTLQALDTFDVKKIADCISRSQQIDDYRVVEIFSMLHDYVYSADLTCQPAYEKGLVITRSWTPSATLIYDDGEHGDWEKNMSKFPKVSIALDRLLINKEAGVCVNQYANVDVYERTYDPETTRWMMAPLKWGTAYSKDIFVRIGKVHDGAMADTAQPYNYDPELGFLDLPGIFIPLKSELEAKLLYEPSDTQKQKAIIRYIKSLKTE